MFDFRRLYDSASDKIVCTQLVQDILGTDSETARVAIDYFERLGFLDKEMISKGVKYWSITSKAEAIWSRTS